MRARLHPARRDTMPNTEQHLRRKLETRTATLALLGFDAPTQERLRSLLAAASQRVHTLTEDSPNLEALTDADVVLIDARVRLSPASGADTTSLSAFAERLARVLRVGQLVVVCGPVPPGTSRTLVLPLLTTKQLVPARDFFLAHTPDLEPAGRSCIIGGLDQQSQELAALFLAQTGLPVVSVASLETAELCGLLASVYRTTQRALDRELRVLCDRMGADFWEAHRTVGLPEPAPMLANEHSASAMLVWGARRFGASTRLLEVAGEINSAAPRFLLNKIEDCLNRLGQPVRGSRVLLLVNAVATHPENPRQQADELKRLLLTKGAIVHVHEPHATSPLTAEVLRSQDVVVILAAHAGVDADFLVAHSRLVLDTCNATHAVTVGHARIVRV